MKENNELKNEVKNLSNKLERCYNKLAVLNDQTRPPIKTKKEEKLAILNTYAFTINQVPHVFGGYYFVGHKHKYME